MKLYDTYAGTIYAGKIKSQEAEVLSLLTSESIVEKLATDVYGLSVRADDSIGQWEHPFYSEKANGVMIDFRPYQTRTGEVKDRHNAGAFVTRASLENTWVKNPEEFELYSNELASTFAVWIGNVLRSRFAITELDVSKTKVVAVLHYLTVILERKRLKSMHHGELESHVTRIATRILRLPAVVVQQTLEDEVCVELIKNGMVGVHMFTAALNSVSVTPMNDLTFDTLLQVALPGAWAGKDERQLTGIMFEHPPTLMWMIERYQSLGFFRKVSLGMAMESLRRQVDYERVERFVKQL